MRISDWSSDVCSSDLEGRRGEGQVERVAAEEAGLPFEAHALAEFLRRLAVDLGQVEADYLAAKLAGEPARRPTDAAAKLEQQLASLRVEALRQLGGRLAAAAVELLVGGEIGGGEAVGLLFRGRECGGDWVG